MKLKYLILIITCCFIGTISVNASSITYNLNIDKNLEFKEDVVYKVKNSELDNSGNYDFLTSVVNDKIYFDNNKSVKYKKTKSYSNGVYTVHLKNDYSYLFLSGSRILNECFSSFDFDIDDEDYLYFNSSSPFYCTKRADTITVNVTTDLKVSSHNANTFSGKTYTWNKIDDSFTLRMNIVKAKNESSSEPLDEIITDENDSVESDTNYDENDGNSESTEKEDIKKSISPIIILIILGGFFIGLIIIIVLKTKSKNVNKL